MVQQDHNWRSRRIRLLGRKLKAPMSSLCHFQSGDLNSDRETDGVREGGGDAQENNSHVLQRRCRSRWT